jgi:hypothetical protein
MLFTGVMESFKINKNRQSQISYFIYRSRQKTKQGHGNVMD